MMNLKKFTFNPYQENTYVLFDETGSCVILDTGLFDYEQASQAPLWVKEME